MQTQSKTPMGMKIHAGQLWIMLFLGLLLASCASRKKQSTSSTGIRYHSYAQLPGNCVDDLRREPATDTNRSVRMHFGLQTMSLNGKTIEVKSELTLDLGNESDLHMLNDSVGVKFFRLSGFEYGDTVELYRWDLVFRNAACIRVIHSSEYKPLPEARPAPEGKSVSSTQTSMGRNTYGFSYSVQRLL